MNSRVLWLVCALLMSAIPLRAEVLILKNGGRIEGDLIAESSDPKNRYYLVKTATGGVVKLWQAQVERVVRKSAALIEYEKNVSRIEDTVDSHWRVAKWCLENKLQRQREFHLEQIIRLDPDHEHARHGLGYSKVKGKWLKNDEWNRAQGMVMRGRTWRTRQEILIEEFADRFDKAQKKWRKDLKMWRSWVNKRRHADAIAKIRAIRDPIAAKALGDLMAKEMDFGMRLEFVAVLGRLPVGAAKGPLIEAAIDDLNETVRAACLKELQKEGTQQAVKAFVKVLNPKGQKNNLRINRAGIALSWMKDKEAIPALIDAVVTKHIGQTSGAPNGATRFSPTFGTGGSGFNFGGGGPKTIVRDVVNTDVIAALRKMTGEDFGTNKDAWRKWYVDANTPRHVNLRRLE
ncbi:MAG: hypothetical protein IH991_07580 [Planctomycetes bacterium]|nr:hypothetical protein [Planctomycetota bacterium]